MAQSLPRIFLRLLSMRFIVSYLVEFRTLEINSTSLAAQDFFKSLIGSVQCCNSRCDFQSLTAIVWDGENTEYFRVPNLTSFLSERSSHPILV